METELRDNTPLKAKPLAELFPRLGLLPKDTSTAYKKSRPTLTITRTDEKHLKALTFAELNLNALQVNLKKKKVLPASSAKKTGWNSSIKVNRKKSHLETGNIKRNTVRKLFPPNNRPQCVTSTTPKIKVPLKTPSLSKQEISVKRSAQLDSNPVRLSGINKIPYTPIERTQSQTSAFIRGHKTNISYQACSNKKVQFQPITPATHRVALPIIEDSPLPVDPCTDTSFLRTEKEMQDIVDKSNAIVDKQTLEHIKDILPEVSTPFTKYRSIQEYFNNTCDMENSKVVDNTITCFEKSSLSNDTEKNKDESIIVSLCELLNKATVTNDNDKQKIEPSVEFFKAKIEHNIALTDHFIKNLQQYKESQQKLLMDINQINGKKENETCSHEIILKHRDQTHKITSSQNKKQTSTNISPSYKIPKKTSNLRKQVFHKSLPSFCSQMHSPKQDKVLNMYMQMKEKMNFLNTPIANRKIKMAPPDSPALMSQNLQQQLKKLFS